MSRAFATAAHVGFRMPCASWVSRSSMASSMASVLGLHLAGVLAGVVRCVSLGLNENPHALSGITAIAGAAGIPESLAT